MTLAAGYRRRGSIPILRFTLYFRNCQIASERAHILSKRKETALIQVENVTKRFGQRIAVDNLNFSVDKGEILGFLGPNGAGKSTTMNIITGYLSATDGTVTVDGHEILEEPEAVKRQIGYMPEQPPLYLDMTVEDFLSFVCDIKSVPRQRKGENIDRALSMLALTDVRGRLIKNLSKGYKQRVGVAQALIGSPPVLILDEPTIGLDPQQIIETRNLIRELGKEHTIILSSHILPEVAAVCTRVLIINKGRIVASDTPDNLSKGMVGDNKLTLRVAGAEQQALAALRAVGHVVKAESLGSREPGTVDVLVEAKREHDIRKPVFYAMSKADLPILSMRAMDISLEDIFLNLTTEEKEVSST
jgi:ABC-2 type transport system ATP-binding protein